MSNNEIADIEDDALGRLEILVTLQLHDNKLSTVPASLPSSLSHLHLHNNQIADIQPAIFAQLDNLETLDLSGNQLIYMPGLPLPRLLVLNLRASGLLGISQSVVQTSPQLKDLLLEGNPIKCTDLMGIAEWTTACRSEVPNDIPTNPAGSPGIGGLLQTISSAPMCCGRPVVYKNANLLSHKRPASCKREATIIKPLDAVITPTKRSRKAKMEEIWRALSLSNFTATSTEKGDGTMENHSMVVNHQHAQMNKAPIENQTDVIPTNDELTAAIIGSPLPNGLRSKNMPNDNDDRNQPQPNRTTPSYSSTTSKPNMVGDKKKLLRNATTPDKKNNKSKPSTPTPPSSASASTPRPPPPPRKVGQLEINSGSSEAPPLSKAHAQIHTAKAAGQTFAATTTHPDFSTFTTTQHSTLSPLAAVSLFANDGADESQHLAADSLVTASSAMRGESTRMTKEAAMTERAAASPPPTTGSTVAPKAELARCLRRFDNNQRSAHKPRTSSNGPNAQHTVGEHADWNTNKVKADAVNEPGRLETRGGRRSGGGSGNDDRRIHHLPNLAVSGLRDAVPAKSLPEDEAHNNDLAKAFDPDVIKVLDKRPVMMVSGSHDYVNDAEHSSWAKVERIKIKTNDDDHHHHLKCTNCSPSINDTAADDINNIYVAEQSLVVAEITDGGAPLPNSKHDSDLIASPMNGEAADKSDADPLNNASPSSRTKTINEERRSVVVSPADVAPAVIVHSSHHLHNHQDAAKDNGHHEMHSNGIRRTIGGGPADDTSTSSGLPEQWNAVRTSAGHPGLFIVLGVTIGMFATLVLIQVYRCARPWQQRRVDGGGGGGGDDEDPDQYAPTHRDMLPMELLGDANRSTIQYSEAPIEMW